MRKKILSVLTVCSLILTISIAHLSGVRASDTTFEDISGLSCENAVNSLFELGIVAGMTENTFAPNETLTRAQMAAILVRAYGQENTDGGKTFEDVPESHWAYSYISAAAAMGMVNGVSETLFEPETNVTLEQCVTMLVRVLGYGDEAEELGGYPKGYMDIGRDLHLVKGVSEQNVKAPLTRADMAIMVYNSLSANDNNTSATNNDEMNMYENSDFIEKEQPELDEETKQLISLYQNDPTDENYFNLREKVIEDYNAVVARKETKLSELKTETEGKPGGEEIVAEMEELVQDIYITYWDRINSSMLRFTDPRLLEWKVAAAPRYEYIPVMGAGESIYVKRTPVTNAEYAEFLSETGYPAPSNWTDGTYPSGEDNYPVNFISYEDAQAYCDWLTEQDGVNTYRLPNESEWELAAGHMPKDADFNCGVNDGRTPVDEYADVTRGAHGAIDFWGNVWEWTSTVRSESNDTTILGVKGGAWNSDRTDCRTEYREEGRDASEGYEDVGFRVIQVLNGEEPEQVELTTLESPVVSAVSPSANTVELSWQPVEGAVEYQIYEYYEETGLVKMLDRVTETSITFENLEPGTYRYIVQPISYIEIADNVSAENSVAVTCQ